jgi:hypothetical protein
MGGIAYRGRASHPHPGLCSASQRVRQRWVRIVRTKCVDWMLVLGAVTSSGASDQCGPPTTAPGHRGLPENPNERAHPGLLPDGRRSTRHATFSTDLSMTTDSLLEVGCAVCAPLRVRVGAKFGFVYPKTVASSGISFSPCHSWETPRMRTAPSSPMLPGGNRSECP